MDVVFGSNGMYQSITNYNNVISACINGVQDLFQNSNRTCGEMCFLYKEISQLEIVGQNASFGWV